MNKLKNNKGVTMIALVVTIIIMAILLTVVNYGSQKGLEMKDLNNMYADILILDEKVALYYLNTGKLPIKEPATKINVVGNIKDNNPNNKDDEFYELDITKLDNITLNNMKDKRNSSDRYVINAVSHTIYYQKGVRIDGKPYYTIPEDFQEINLSIYQ